MAEQALSTIDTRTMSQQVYARVRQAIAMEELAPGERVTERGLAAQLSVSATPVREALIKLISEGLIERVSSRTLRVTNQPQPNLQQRIEAEAAMRGVVARFAAKHINDEDLKQLASLLAAAEPLVAELRGAARLAPGQEELARDLLRYMRAFNDVVERASGNPALLAACAQVQALGPGEHVEASLRLMRAGAFGGEQRWNYHDELLDALRKHDEVRAEQVTIEQSLDYLTELVGA